MATNATEIMAAVVVLVEDITSITRASGDIKTSAPGSGQITAEVLYPGEDLSFFVVNTTDNRITHDMPLQVKLRSSSADDGVMTDALYDVLDTLTKPTTRQSLDVTLITPESIDPIEREAGLSTSSVFVTVKFRRNRATAAFIRVTSDGFTRTTSNGDTRIVLQ
jgi:hypothetical protein